MRSLEMGLDRAIDGVAQMLGFDAPRRIRQGLPPRLAGAARVTFEDREVIVGLDPRLRAAWTNPSMATDYVARALVSRFTVPPRVSMPEDFLDTEVLYGPNTRWYRVGPGFMVSRLWCPRGGTLTRPRVMLIHPDADVRLAVALGLGRTDDAILAHMATNILDAAVLIEASEPDLVVIDERLVRGSSRLPTHTRRVVIANAPDRRGPGIVPPPSSQSSAGLQSWVRHQLTPALRTLPKRSCPTLPPMRMSDLVTAK